MESLPDRVRSLRKDRGWSQAELAERAGVAVNKIEAGTTPNPSQDVVAAIARAFGMTADALTAGTAPLETSRAAKRAKKVEMQLTRAHVATHLEQVLEEFADRLTLKQARDLESLAAAKGASLEDIREMAKLMLTKAEKRVPERVVGPPEKKPKRPR
jgi:transcriptional regulator with XRE-family HTH domain